MTQLGSSASHVLQEEPGASDRDAGETNAPIVTARGSSCLPRFMFGGTLGLEEMR